MQFRCRRAKMLNNLENKGESGDFSQMKRIRNCAIRDAVAQLKMKWRKLVGADMVENSTCQCVTGIVILNCMTRPFSLRARPSLIAAIDARAAQLGQDRTKYILSVVERDLAEEKPRKHKFASHDLMGAFHIGTGPATNENTRRIIAQRLKERSEKNR
jgi:hypothetical protein